MIFVFLFFFFKQKTAYEMRISDWSQTCALPIFDLTAADLVNASGTQNRSEKFCVYSNDTTEGLYSISVNGTPGSELNSGELKFGLNGPSGILDLGFWVSDQANAAYARGTATPGQERANFKTTAGGQARPTTLNCGGGSNASQIGRAHV